MIERQLRVIREVENTIQDYSKLRVKELASKITKYIHQVRLKH